MNTYDVTLTTKTEYEMAQLTICVMQLPSRNILLDFMKSKYWTQFSAFIAEKSSPTFPKMTSTVFMQTIIIYELLKKDFGDDAIIISLDFDNVRDKKASCTMESLINKYIKIRDKNIWVYEDDDDLCFIEAIELSDNSMLLPMLFRDNDFDSQNNDNHKIVTAIERFYEIITRNKELSEAELDSILRKKSTITLWCESKLDREAFCERWKEYSNCLAKHLGIPDSDIEVTINQDVD